MARKQEDQLHDKLNHAIGFARSNLRHIQTALHVELLEAKKLSAEQSVAVRSFADEVAKRFAVVMPMMKPEEE